MHFWLLLVIVIFSVECRSQVLQLGLCAQVNPVSNFDLNNFLGTWYEIERFPIWYENNGQCAYKVIQRKEDIIEIQHHYVLGDIEFVLHVNSTIQDQRIPIFDVSPSVIDTIGIPLTVVATDYSNFAVVYGCRHHEELHFRFVSSWILSRSKIMEAGILAQAYRAVNSLPQSSTAYMEPVSHTDSQCSHIWTAHVEE